MSVAVSLKHYESVAKIFDELSIRNDEDVERLAVFAELLDEKIRKGQTKWENLFNYVTSQITGYEKENVQLPEVSGVAMLRYLMDQYGHKQKDLEDVVSPSVISEILSGKRPLNQKHIEELSKKYNVSPALFF